MHDPEPGIVLNTDRLMVRRALPGDEDVYLSLWTDPRIMSNVGFPNGLSVSRDDIRERLSNQPDSDLDRLLVVIERGSGDPVGECMLHGPDGSGIARTDIKLLPGSWGRGYGTELKRALLSYLFTNTDCDTVEATPNRENLRSIRMQEAVGGVRTGEGSFTFQPGRREVTAPVHYLVYQVSRSTWERTP